MRALLLDDDERENCATPCKSETLFRVLSQPKISRRSKTAAGSIGHISEKTGGKVFRTLVRGVSMSMSTDRSGSASGSLFRARSGLEGIAEDQKPKESLFVALFECGVVSVSIFLLSMVPYLLTVPLCPCDANSATCSWLNFWGAAGFIVNSGLDIACCLLYVREQSDDDNVKTETACAKVQQYLRRVHWGFWSAFTFLIPSLLYQAETLVDANIVGPYPGQFLNTTAGIDPDNFSAGCDWAAVIIFIGSALLCNLAWLYADEGVSDWNLVGNLLYLLATLMELGLKFLTCPTELQRGITQGTWSISAVVEVFAALLLVKERRNAEVEFRTSA